MVGREDQYRSGENVVKSPPFTLLSLKCINDPYTEKKTKYRARSTKQHHTVMKLLLAGKPSVPRYEK